MPQPLLRPIGTPVSQGKKLIPTRGQLAVMKADIDTLGRLAEHNNLNSSQLQNVLKGGHLQPVLDRLTKLQSGKMGGAEFQARISNVLEQKMAKRPFAFWAKATTKTLQSVNNRAFQTLAGSSYSGKSRCFPWEKS